MQWRSAKMLYWICYSIDMHNKIRFAKSFEEDINWKPF